MDDGFFNRPIISHTQIFVHRWGAQNVDCVCHFADGPNQSLVSSVVQAIRGYSSMCKTGQQKNRFDRNFAFHLC